MKKDGTHYLALIEHMAEVTPEWYVVHWGIPVAFSDEFQKSGWLTSNKIKLKVSRILAYKELNDIISEIPHETLAR